LFIAVIISKRYDDNPFLLTYQIPSMIKSTQIKIRNVFASTYCSYSIPTVKHRIIVIAKQKRFAQCTSSNWPYQQQGILHC